MGTAEASAALASGGGSCPVRRPDIPSAVSRSPKPASQVRLQPRQHRQPLLGRRAAHRAEQPRRHQQREQVQRVIDRRRLQVAHHRDQRPGPLRVSQPGQRRGLTAQAGAGKHLQPVRRDVHPASAQRGELPGPLQRLDHLRSRAAARRAAQPLEFGNPRPVRDLQQGREPVRQPRIDAPGCGGQSRLQPVLGGSRAAATCRASTVTSDSSTRLRRSHRSRARTGPPVPQRASTPAHRETCLLYTSPSPRDRS